MSKRWIAPLIVLITIIPTLVAAHPADPSWVTVKNPDGTALVDSHIVFTSVVEDKKNGTAGIPIPKEGVSWLTNSAQPLEDKVVQLLCHSTDFVDGTQASCRGLHYVVPGAKIWIVTKGENGTGRMIYEFEVDLIETITPAQQADRLNNIIFNNTGPLRLNISNCIGDYIRNENGRVVDRTGRLWVSAKLVGSAPFNG